jgi:hypothetical protein
VSLEYSRPVIGFQPPVISHLSASIFHHQLMAYPLRQLHHLLDLVWITILTLTFFNIDFCTKGFVHIEECTQ